MELVIQGIGGGIVGAALIRIPLLLFALWRQAGYRKQEGRVALEGFRRRVQAAKARHLRHERTEPAVTATFPGIEVVFGQVRQDVHMGPERRLIVGTCQKKRRQRAFRMPCRQLWQVSHGHQVRRRLSCDTP